MKITNTDRFIAYLTLISGLSISAVAVWYSVAGLISIFAAAVIPIAVMGVTLELSKLVATVWLKQNWFIAPRLIRAYLFSAVVILMLITSMGIFGYLSKAHLDQAVPTGDVAAKVALIDEKIKTERDNIEAARRALTQMDAAVDQTMARSDDVRGADKAAALRRSQAKERQTLQGEIAKAQKTIAQLNEERAPIAAELRKVEAEVGPIKYIAALIYGDNPDNNLLERAVRWMIILIVVIFDPLAVVLLLASQYSFQYFRRQDEEAPKEPDNDPTPPGTDDKNLDRLDNSNDEPARVDTSTNESPTNGYQIPGRIEPSAVTWTMPMPGTMGGATVVFPEDISLVAPTPVEPAPTPVEEFEAQAAERKEEIQEIVKKAHRRSIAPPGTPGEAWLTPMEPENTPTDELDKIYKEATATEAKRRRTRGWLQSNFPKQDE